MKLSLYEIATAVSGKLVNPLKQTITSISTDTRTIIPGALFVPIKGENFDGHNYIQNAAERGAVCALSEVEMAADIPLIIVNSTRKALMDLAGYYRRLFDIKVVAITGSAGKTTTKDMIAGILEQKYKTKKTMKNFNNDIGLPLSIFQLEEGDEALVLEMGMNHGGEIHELSLTGAPDIAVITHIGDAHIENFENREGILNAKLEIVDGLKPNGTVILNGDDPLLTGAIAAIKVKPFIAKYPSNENILLTTPVGLEKTECKFNWAGQDVNITVPLPGAHMVKNALLAVAVGIELGCTPEQITKGFETFAPPAGRLTVEKIGNKTIINDAYNANPASMKEAIKILATEKGRKVAILGDMNELGHVAEERHKEVGAFAGEAGLDLFIAVGGLSKHMYDSFPHTNKIYFSTVEEFITAGMHLLKEDDIVLIKASRGMAFERIITKLQ